MLDGFLSDIASGCSRVVWSNLSLFVPVFQLDMESDDCIEVYQEQTGGI